ncbi:MAG: alpha/beta fold hydrolase [Candidatus Odinarchaeota archaeon]
MPFAEVKNIKICYEIYGEGFPLILVHGYDAKKEVWIAQIKALSEKYKVITFDLRSSGKSDRPEEPYTMDSLVEDLKDLMDYLNIEKVNLIGQSMGGWIIQNFVLKYPERANKLILIATNHKGSGIHVLKESMINELDTLERDPVKAFLGHAKLMYHLKFRKEMEKNLSKKFHGIWSPENLIKESTINPKSARDLKNLADAGASHNTLESLDQIKNPTLLISGSHDRISPKSVLDEMHEKLPISTLKVVDKTGHKLFLSKASEVNQLILEFLKD